MGDLLSDNIDMSLLYISQSRSWLRTVCCASQADKARGFGARVYCVGVMDFDHKQVGGFSFFLLCCLDFHMLACEKEHLSVTDSVGCKNTEVLFAFLCVCFSVC